MRELDPFDAFLRELGWTVVIILVLVLVTVVLTLRGIVL